MLVAPVPSGHPYVRSIKPDSVEFLPDPVVDPTDPERWWPHRVLDRSWWETDPRANDVDVVHVHFGFEHLTPDETRDFTRILSERRIPLVVTVHDIDNPHLDDQTAYHQQLRHLLNEAARVFTLTDDAQLRLRREFSTDAVVVPHPQLAPHDVRPAATRRRVALFAKSLRSNVVADPDFYRDLARRVDLTVFLHDDQRSSALAKSLTGINLVFHAPMSDGELHATVAACDAVVLPYTRGTHSGWLEMCRDLGVKVAVPDCGCYASQVDDPSACAVYATGDGESAADAALKLLNSPGPAQYKGDRTEQRAAVRELHEETYRELSGQSLRIALVAPSRFPVRQPYVGGLEAFCATLTSALRFAGHKVGLYATAGSDGHVEEWEFPGVDWTGFEDQRTDHTYPPGEREKEDAAFERLRRHLEDSDYDVVHNNSLHPGLFGSSSLRLVTTLHAPGFWEVQDGIRDSPNPGIFAAVSSATADTWQLPTPAHIVSNGVDESIWTPGPGGERAVWFGRIVPEKAPHIAIDVARALGMDIDIAGRVGDNRYFAEEIEPRMGPYVHLHGELNQRDLAALVRRSRVCLVTPQWEEPFGLVVIEAMACGTPVAALDRGGVAEVLSDWPQLLASDNASLADAARSACTIDRSRVSQWARESFGRRALAQRYVELYEEAMQ